MSEITRDFLPPNDNKLCDECGFAEWRHGLGTGHQFNANYTNQIKQIISEIPNYIFEYLELSDEIRKEWKYGSKASDFGGHNQFVQEFTRRIVEQLATTPQQDITNDKKGK